MKYVAEKSLVHTVRDDVVAAFRALGELHTCGYVHGDARLPNVLYFNGKALWIDLQPPEEDLDERKPSFALLGKTCRS
jgi:tRNA A-37 threonylcarbamoyl transferase component Bud32